MTATSGTAFWSIPADKLLEQLESRPTGLTRAEAEERLARFGTNTVKESRPTPLLVRIGKRFVEPLVAILLFAAAISGATGDIASFAIILLVITFSIAIDVIQEHRASLAADALKRSVAVHADVLRDGKIASIPVEQVVPGDVIHMRAGDLIPADGIVLQSRNAHLNEALITGEPFPVDKRAGPCNATISADAFSALFAGTSVVGGEATMLVVATGLRTLFGNVAAGLLAAAPPSALERGVHRLGALIMRLTFFLVLFVLLVHLAFGRPVLEAFLFALALAVGLTPELLPMVMTVTLSRGALRLAEKRVIVKRLASIHDLGAMDVLCTDKTGTLTEARIKLIGHPGIDGRDNDWVLTLAGVNSKFESGIRSPLDEAVVQHCSPDQFNEWHKIDEVPFDFERRRVAILAEKAGERFLVIKGALESVLLNAATVDVGGGKHAPLDDAARSRLVQIQNDNAAQGYRALAVAWKSLPAGHAEIRPEDETGLVVAGLCIFVDPPKASAAAAVGRLAALGVRVKVVSGDHDVVVRHLVDTLKIPARGMLTGAELAALTDPALIARVEDVDCFARVSPDQKTRIIRALQARGHTVGFVGDGVNDAPAIRAAEVGISVDTATDVARSAADIILLAQDLGVVADGVGEGRRTLANILKYVRMGTSSNFGNMLSMALASVLLPFLPLLPVQILLNNLLYDLSEVGIPFDDVDAVDQAQPRFWDMSSIIRFTLIMGALSSVFDFATFAVLGYGFGAGADLFRTGWFVESMATQILVIFVIRTQDRPWKSRASMPLVLTSIGALCVAVAIALTPLGRAFSFTAVPVSLLLMIAAIVVIYLLCADVAKSFSQRPGRAPRSGT